MMSRGGVSRAYKDLLACHGLGRTDQPKGHGQPDPPAFGTRKDNKWSLIAPSVTFGAASENGICAGPPPHCAPPARHSARPAFVTGYPKMSSSPVGRTGDVNGLQGHRSNEGGGLPKGSLQLQFSGAQGMHDVRALIQLIQEGLATTATPTNMVAARICNEVTLSLYDMEQLVAEADRNGHLEAAINQQNAYLTFVKQARQREESKLKKGKEDTKSKITLFEKELKTVIARIALHNAMLEEMKAEAAFTTPPKITQEMDEGSASNAPGDDLGRAYEPYKTPAAAQPSQAAYRAAQLALLDLEDKKSRIEHNLMAARAQLEEFEACDEDNPSADFAREIKDLTKTYPLARETMKEFQMSVFISTYTKVLPLLRKAVSEALWTDWMREHASAPAYEQAYLFLDRLLNTCNDISLTDVHAEFVKLVSTQPQDLPVGLTPVAVFDRMTDSRMGITAKAGKIFPITNTHLIVKSCELLIGSFGDALRGPLADWHLRPITAAYGSEKGDIKDATDQDLRKFREVLEAYSHLKTRSRPRRQGPQADSAKPTPGQPAVVNVATTGDSKSDSPAKPADANHDGKKKKKRNKGKKPSSETADAFGTGTGASSRPPTVAVGASDDGWLKVPASDRRRSPPEAPLAAHDAPPASTNMKQAALAKGNLFYILAEDVTSDESDTERDEPAETNVINALAAQLERKPASRAATTLNSATAKSKDLKPVADGPDPAKPTRAATAGDTVKAESHSTKSVHWRLPLANSTKAKSAGAKAAEANSGDKGTKPATRKPPVHGDAFSMTKVDSGADVSIHGKHSPSMTDVTAHDVAIQPLGPHGQQLKSTSRGTFGGVLTCAATGRHVRLTMQAYGGTGNASTIWSTRDITNAGGWVHHGPNGVHYMHLPKHGKFYLTSDGHALVAHPQEGESPGSAAHRARKAALHAGWQPSRVPPQRPRGARAPRQSGQGSPRHSRPGEGPAPRR